MKFEEALAAMREGKMVRRGPCKCGYIIDNYPNYAAILDYCNDTVKLNSGDILSDEWEIVE